jgi:hypothetical protein
LWEFDVLQQRFLQLEEAGLGTLHAFVSPSGEDGAIPLGVSAWPVSATAFALPSFDQFSLGADVQYVAVANSRVLSSDTVGTCPSPLFSQCSHPANLFELTVTQDKARRCASVAPPVLLHLFPTSFPATLNQQPYPTVHHACFWQGVNSLLQEVAEAAQDTQLLMEDVSNKIHGGDALATNFLR